MKESRNTKKTNEQKATTNLKLPKPKQLINKEKNKTKVVLNNIREIPAHKKI